MWVSLLRIIILHSITQETDYSVHKTGNWLLRTWNSFHISFAGHSWSIWGSWLLEWWDNSFVKTIIHYHKLCMNDLLWRGLSWSVGRPKKRGLLRTFDYIIKKMDYFFTDLLIDALSLKKPCLFWILGPKIKRLWRKNPSFLRCIHNFIFEWRANQL